METAKQVVQSFFPGEKISVRKGRGTAHSWIYITTARAVDREIRDAIEAKLVQDRLCGQYYPDYGGGHDSYQANVSWNTTR